MNVYVNTSRLRFGLAALMLLTFGTATSTGEELVSTRTGTSANRVDIIFLGDGYQESELGLYQQHIDGMLAHMFSQQPFNRYSQFFNVHHINVVSNESGADVLPENIDVDNALGSKYYFDGVTERLLYVDQVLADTVMLRSIPFEDLFVPEMQFISVNSDRYGGAGGSFATFAGANDEAYEIAVHEVAHSFSNLTDEYFFPGEYVGPEPDFVNATVSPEGEKWAHWIGYEQAGIGTIGVFEGSHYKATGVYRPSDNSKMRTLGQPFDAVSRETLVLDIYQHLDPVDSFSSEIEIQETQSVTVDVVDPEVIDLSWYVDGELLDGLTGETLELSALAEFGYTSGTYDISAVAQDNTDWVRIRRDELRQELLWENVEVVISEIEINIDSLTEAVIANGTDLTFDLNNDGIVDQLDRIAWLETNNSLFGDADLDGDVDFGDFLALSENFGSDNANWADGNFTVDKDVNFSDFLLVSENFGTSVSDPPSGEASSAPEPSAITIACCGVAMLLLGSRRHSRRNRRGIA